MLFFNDTGKVSVLFIISSGITVYFNIFSGDVGFIEAAKAAVDQAVVCGRTINVECADYAISLKTASRDDNSKVDNLYIQFPYIISYLIFNMFLQAIALMKSIENIKASPLGRSSKHFIGPPGMLRQVSSGSPGSGGEKKTKRKTNEPTVTYLNVHAGVSVGVMAGVDVGAQDRFEVSAEQFCCYAV